MIWHPCKDAVGDWSWHTADFPNGWSASVFDFMTRDRTTIYYIQANAKDRAIQGKESFLDFAEAKSAAIRLTLEQPEMVNV
jgi:hypothetical protein